MNTGGRFNHCALALAALCITAQASATVLRADYTLDFKPPSPNSCASVGSLGDLSGANLSGMLSFSYLNDAGLAIMPPGPPSIPGLTCGTSYSGSFSFDVDAASPSVFVSFDGVLSPPGPPTLPAVQFPTYAFPAGTDPAAVLVPPGPPIMPLSVLMPPGPPAMPLYAFNDGAYQIGALNVTLQAVPAPAAGWLLGSGLLGLIGVNRRVISKRGIAR